MQPTVLVTGGAGFIGSHLVTALVEAGERVRILDDFSTGQRENLAQLAGQVEVLEGSVTEPGVVAEAVHGTKTIYHLAALASVQQSVDAPRKSHEVCATGTLTVLDEARRAGVKRVVYAGSSSAYGNGSDGALTEDEPLDPLSPYAAAKLAGEHYCRSFTATFGLETVRLRFFNIFGPRQRSDSPYSGVIALFAAALTANRRPTLFGDGLQSRDFTEVADAVQALRLAAKAPSAVGQVYNVGTGQAVTLLQLLGELNDLLGTSIEPILGPPRTGDVRHSRADIARARRDLGYAPSVSFAAGLRRLLGK